MKFDQFTSANSVSIKPSEGSWLSSPLIGPKPPVEPAGGVGPGRRVGVGVGAGVPARSDGIRPCTVVSDMANPNPSTLVSEILKVLMPTISPDIESIGPPLLPGLIGASVCITQD